MNILVVDHSKVFRALWHKLVLKAGHEPIMVATGEEGLEELKRRRVDLVCVSLTLPDTDGIEFCRLARKTRRGRHVPLILLTSTEDKAARMKAFEAGATDIHSKTDIEELFNQAARFVEEDEQRISGRVLYVEDSSVVAHVMLKILERLGLEVDHYTSATDAYEAFGRHAYDLVISDILVEGEMSGMGLVSRIREKFPDKARVPILAVSGMDDITRRMELFRLGVNDFISKPVIEEEVVARVSNLISNKQLFDQVRAQRRHLYELAMIDQLTGLYNRNSLSEFAKKAFSEANRHDFPLSLILIDLDHFKEINDTHGHLTGDEVLASIGEMLKNNCRDEDFAVRFGGEELMLILPHCTHEDAVQRAEELRQAVETLKPSGIPMTASLGVTSRPHGREVSMEDLFRIADKAVYQAKEKGRNQVIALTAQDYQKQLAAG
ncbi:two-component system cell cycle response regulator [Natronospira proteinivora]|uniref:diguanylate cyclase n=1 Tax=Natronospira proteinivora TaxID=1807133 RepID=A0ABT1GBZ4_9GAMM|nr:diguanylate cyclase [Natronospira proteinivora]MCP1728455.1 two-component system cell cycle response regulator [Natronospira proteinivora]